MWSGRSSYGKQLLLYILAAVCLGNVRAGAQPEMRILTEGERAVSYPTAADTAAILAIIDSSAAAEQSDPERSVKLLQEALHLSREAGYTYGLARSFLHLGKSHAHAGSYTLSLKYFRQAILFSNEEQRGRQLIPEIFNGIGNVYQIWGDFRQAAIYYYQAAMIAEQLAGKDFIGSIYNNSAAMMMQLGFSRQFILYLDKAEQVARQEKNYGLQGSILLNKGNIYQADESWDEALKYYQLGLELSLKHDIPRIRQAALSNLGNLWLLRGEPELALPYVLEAVRVTGVRNPFEVNTVHVTLGRVYAALGEYSRAENILQTALQNAQHMNLSRDVVRANKTLSEIYEASGSYRQALRHYQNYVQLKDSIAHKGILRDINTLEFKYRSALKDKEILRQQTQLNEKNLWLVSISGMSVLFLLLALSIYISYRRRQYLQQERVRNMQQEQEIEKLHAVMEAEEKERGRIARELHDGIGGMLASIQMNLSVAKDEHSTDEKDRKLKSILNMVTDTAAEVRKTSHNLMPDALIRNNLEKALMLYCEQVNAANRLQVDLECHGNLKQLGKVIELAIYRISQELIQNIIKHAGATQALVQIMEHNHILSITVEDNGNGFDPDEQPGGFGIQNLRHRVNTLHGSLSIMSAKGRSTTVFIEFDLQKLNMKSVL